MSGADLLVQFFCKPSAFESEIHPSHKTTFYALCISPLPGAKSRNMFYNEQGKHVRTKKEILDDSGNVRKGCKVIKKGEVYEQIPFTIKNPLFKQEAFVDEAKGFYTDLINLLIKDDKDKLHVFDKNGLYLAPRKSARITQKPKPCTKRYQEKADRQNANRPYQSRDKGAR